jgi:hypothetical protein
VLVPVLLVFGGIPHKRVAIEFKTYVHLPNSSDRIYKVNTHSGAELQTVPNKDCKHRAKLQAFIVPNHGSIHHLDAIPFDSKAAEKCQRKKLHIL